MAMTTQEILAGINASFADATAWARAMEMSAAQVAVLEAEAALDRVESQISVRDAAENDALAAARTELAAANAALEALGDDPGLGG